MKGKISYSKTLKRYYVTWYHSPEKKTYKIYRYKGQYLYDRRLAEKLLAAMQGDTENGTFKIERFTRYEHDVLPYLRKWLEAIKTTISPATYKDYGNSIENHLVPFFEAKAIQLHEIQYDTLMELLSSIDRDGKGKLNVMYCLHTCLKYAWKAGRIPSIPPFPDRKNYQIVEPPIRWLRENRQKEIIEAIPLEHQPIFWFLKHHLRRPGEAMALHKEDFDGAVFTIRRGFSNKVEVERTKTGEIHIIPMVDAMEPFMMIEQKKQKLYGIISRYLFVHPNGKKEGKHYTHKTLTSLWDAACKAVGESIDLYSGLKHSSCSQLVNEHYYSIHDVQAATDHARLESVKKYTKIEVSLRKSILEKTKVVQLKESWHESARNSEHKN